MDRVLHLKLVTLLLKIPDIEDFATRTDLLVGLPNRASLLRNQASARTDISRLVDQLAEVRLQTGEWGLSIVVENALARLEQTTTGGELADLHQQLLLSMPHVESMDSVQSQTKVQRSTAPQQASLSISRRSSPQPLVSSAPPQSSLNHKRVPGVSFPHGYALIVGISSYSDNRIGELSEAIIKDALDMHTVLRSPDFCGYHNDHVRLLYNDKATTENICNGLNWLAQAANADKDATVIFYFSGHGGRVEIDEQIFHYLVSYDCNLDNLDDTAIASTELIQLLQAIQAPRLLTLLDSCYSGGADEIKGIELRQNILKYGQEEDYYQQLAQGQGRFIIASSRSTETSRSSSSMNNSLFTHYLLEALQGKSYTQGDGLIRVSDIFGYVYAQVSKHRPQHPVISSRASENFPIALYLGGKRTEVNREQSQDQEIAIDQTALRKAVLRNFRRRADLRALCADVTQTLHDQGIVDIWITPDALDGNTLPEQVLSLIEELDQRGYLFCLPLAARKSRPDFVY